MKTYYEILNIEKNSTQLEIKKAYFNMIRKYPPDKFSKEFIEIRKAYDTLIDPKLKEDYDMFSNIPSSLMDYFGDALKYKENGYDDIGIKLLEEILSDVKKYDIIYCGLAEFYIDNGNYQKAIKVLEELTKKNPLNSKFSERLVVAYYKRNWGKKANTEFERACSLDIDSFDLWAELIDCINEYKGYEKLQEYVKKAILRCEKKGWDNTDFYINSAKNAIEVDDVKLLIGYIDIFKSKLEKYSESKDDKLSESIKDISVILNDIGFLLFKKDELKKSLEILEFLIKIEPKEVKHKENRDSVVLKIELYEMIDELTKINKISKVLIKILENTHIIDDDSEDESSSDFFWEIYYLNDPNLAKQEVKYIKMNYPKIYEVYRDYFNDVLSKDLEIYIPIMVRQSIIDKGNEKRFIEFVERENLSKDKAMKLLDLAKFKSVEQVINENKIGRNDPCICGSGKKYKKCCLK